MVKSAVFGILLIIALAKCDTKIETLDAKIKSCEIPFGIKKFYSPLPLVFRENGDFYNSGITPDGYEAVTIEANDNVVLSCSPNYFRNRGRTEKLNVSCQNNGMFKITNSGEVLRPQNLTCDLRTVEEIISEVPGCPPGKNSTKFGYVNPKDNMAYVIGESCYDTIEGRTIFAHVKLGVINYLEKQDRKFLTQSHPSSNYKLELFRSLRFDEMYKRIQLALKIASTSTPFFSVNHLLDERLLSHNQLVATKKLGWNYVLLRDELNVWRLLKDDIKSLSNKTNLDVYVGTHGVNVLESESGKLPLYIYDNGDKKKFPIPAIIWVLVKNEKTAVVFGIQNNPNANESTLCKSECSKINWLKSVKGKEKTLFCCDYNEAKTFLTEIPEFNEITDLYV